MTAEMVTFTLEDTLLGVEVGSVQEVLGTGAVGSLAFHVPSWLRSRRFNTASTTAWGGRPSRSAVASVSCKIGRAHV